MDTFLNLIGQNEEKVVNYMKGNGLQYQIVYTKSAKTDESKSEKRVIRINNKNNSLEILVGFFKPPVA